MILVALSSSLAIQPSALAQEPEGTEALQDDPQSGASVVPERRDDAAIQPPVEVPNPAQGQVVAPARSPPVPAIVPEALLPEATRDPMAIDPAADPILNLVRQNEDAARFRQILATAIATNPTTDEALARTAEARANEDLAVSQLYPVADFTVSYFGTLARNFSDDPGNLLERSRPRSRADVLASVQQPLIDFGATRNRIAAENDRVAAANYDELFSAAQVALGAVSAWNNVFGYRALVNLGEAFQGSQGALRDLVEERIESGVSAAGDYAQVESYLAAADARLADYRRAVASAEANFRELAGVPVPQRIGPAPMLAPMPTLEETERLAALIPAVLAARKRADAAERDLRAVRADQLPRVTAGVDAGDYGVLDRGRDYDVRANIALTYRLGLAGPARVDAAQARAGSAEAAYARIRNQAVRDARIAWTDVDALQTAATAIEANYLASRRARDVLLERFRVARGSLIDVLAAEDNFFQVAARYVQVMAELGVARTVLLARTALLVDAIGPGAPIGLDCVSYCMEPST